MGTQKGTVNALKGKGKGYKGGNGKGCKGGNGKGYKGNNWNYKGGYRSPGKAIGKDQINTAMTIIKTHGAKSSTTTIAITTMEIGKPMRTTVAPWANLTMMLARCEGEGKEIKTKRHKTNSEYWTTVGNVGGRETQTERASARPTKLHNSFEALSDGDDNDNTDNDDHHHNTIDTSDDDHNDNNTNVNEVDCPIVKDKRARPTKRQRAKKRARISTRVWRCRIGRRGNSRRGSRGSSS